MRKKITVIFLICIVSAAGCRNSQKSTTDEMIDFVSAEGGFKAAFPCKPVKSERTIDSKFGKLSEQVFSCQTETGTYSIGYRDYLSAPASSGEVYDEEKDRLLREYKNELVDVKYNDGERNGYAARYFTGDDSKPFGNPPRFRHVRELQLLKGNRHFIVLAVVATDEQQLHDPLLWTTYDFLQRFNLN
jgi:hypothetical protein